MLKTAPGTKKVLVIQKDGRDGWMRWGQTDRRLCAASRQIQYLAPDRRYLDIFLIDRPEISLSYFKETQRWNKHLPSDSCTSASLGKHTTMPTGTTMNSNFLTASSCGSWPSSYMGPPILQSSYSKLSSHYLAFLVTIFTFSQVSLGFPTPSYYKQYCTDPHSILLEGITQDWKGQCILIFYFPG